MLLRSNKINIPHDTESNVAHYISSKNAQYIKYQGIYRALCYSLKISQYYVKAKLPSLSSFTSIIYDWWENVEVAVISKSQQTKKNDTKDTHTPKSVQNAT